MSAPLVMLHLGLGYFHRAHQAAYLHALRETGDTNWALAGGNTRPDMMPLIASLVAQGGAYTLETVTPGGERSYTRIGSIETVVPYEPELSGLIGICGWRVFVRLRRRWSIRIINDRLAGCLFGRRPIAGSFSWCGQRGRLLGGGRLT